MTKQEFNDWKQVTEKSRYNWVCDRCQWENHRTYLFFKGGENGQFINITGAGEVTLGTYEGAIPCITDACFKVQHRRQFVTQEEALTTIIEKAGLLFLLDFVGIPAYRH